MEIQLSIFKHFKYSGKLKKKEQNATIDLRNTKEKITCQWIFYSSIDKFSWKNESD